MKTRELIEALQLEDPSGELEVIAGGTPIYFASRQPAYYDGPLQMLIHDESKRPYYSIVGYKVTQHGEKVRLHLMGLDECMLDEQSIPVDLTELGEYQRGSWEKRVAELREQMREIHESVNEWAEKRRARNAHEAKVIGASEAAEKEGK